MQRTDGTRASVPLSGFVDHFDDDRRAGAVNDSSSAGGPARLVTDVEGVIGIDHGALRIKPMVQQEWGRAHLLYGPIDRRDGLVLAITLLNGHNTSQSEKLSDSFARRLYRWLQGHTNSRPSLVRRAGEWLRYPRKRILMRQLRSWHRMARAEFEPLDENLQIGFIPTLEPGRPSATGETFVMHAARGDNGELWVRSGSALLPVASGVQNVPICYAIILREVGAAYYVASLPRANGTAQFPRFRPIAIDAGGREQSLFAGVHQAVLGQIGFRVDTRVYGVELAPVERFATWFGTAHAADRLIGTGSLDGRTATIGGAWLAPSGAFAVTDRGAEAAGIAGVAVLTPDAPTGLVHTNVTRKGSGATGGLVVRWRDDHHHVRLEVSTSEATLVAIDGQAEAVLATDRGGGLDAGETAAFQVLDDGRHLRVSSDGQALFGGPVAFDGEPGTGVGISASTGCDLVFDSFEAHPTEIDLSGEIQLSSPWFETGDVVVVADNFSSDDGHDLAGHQTSVGAKTWQRDVGAGRIVVREGRAEVDASTERPNPGETIYTVPWDVCCTVDVAATVTPPGTGRGEGQRGRGGLVLWENSRNYLVVSMYVDDTYDGASIAIFSHLDGFEDIYDAVWSMVGDKIYWGRSHCLRVVSDGEHVLTFIDDEPVLYRSISDLYADRGPLRITRVGVAANWEWGDDTGTAFSDFTVRSGGSTS